MPETINIFSSRGERLPLTEEQATSVLVNDFKENKIVIFEVREIKNEVANRIFYKKYRTDVCATFISQLFTKLLNLLTGKHIELYNPLSTTLMFDAYEENKISIERKDVKSKCKSFERSVVYEIKNIKEDNHGNRERDKSI